MSVFRQTLKKWIPARWREKSRLYRLRLRKVWRLSRLRLTGTGEMHPLGKETARDYCERSGARWHPVYAAQTLRHPLSRCLGSTRVPFEDIVPSDLPELGVAELPGGYIFGVEGWILSRDRRLIIDQTVFARDKVHWPPWPSQIRMRRLKGTCLSLAAEWGYMNYGHFLIDGLTRFDVFSKSGLSLSEVDYVFTSVPSPGLKALVWALGIPESKCIWGESGVAWKADRLLFCHYPGSYCQFAPEAPLFLQHALQAPAPKPGKRIYIQRNSRRKIVNESEILPALLAHGFEIYNYPGVFEQQRAFSEAECVIGVHGADMANLAFCAPGTRVLEIVPTAHQFAFFTNLSGAAGLKHFHWVAPSLEEKVPGWLGPSYADVRVDAVEFRRVLGEFMKN